MFSRVYLSAFVGAMLFGLFGLLPGPAAAATLETPANEISWVAERKPFEAPRDLRMLLHNPNAVADSGLSGMHIDVRNSRSGDTYEA